MTGDGFEIKWEAVSSTLFIRLSGFWSEATFSDYVCELTKATDAISGWYMVLIDASNYEVQSQATVTGHETISAAHQAKVTRTAVFGGGAILRMQAKRSTNTATSRLFSTEAEARAWLSGP